MHYLAVYGHKVMAEEEKLLTQLSFNILTGRSKLADVGVNSEAVAWANYLAWISVDLNVFIGGGTPVSLIGPDGNVLDSGVVPNAGPPVFDKNTCQAVATQAMTARKACKTAFLEVSRDVSDTFAARYGWLAGASNKAADAQQAEALLLKRMEAGA